MSKDGQIYTPNEIVCLLLDYASYTPDGHILRKHVIDNSCGDGQILQEVVRRYAKAYLKAHPFGWGLGTELSKYIHGIEIDPEECIECESNLTKAALEFGVDPDELKWDIRCGNSLVMGKEYTDMDYVLGNPPYIRTHDMKGGSAEDYEIFKEYSFAKNGMADLYLAFYELGMHMCKPVSGIMCYIAPSSWLGSSSGQTMRNYIQEKHNLSAVLDFEHEQVFPNAQTYVLIALFDGYYHNVIRYDRYDSSTNDVIPSMIVPYDEAYINGSLYFGTRNDLYMLRDVLSAEGPYKVKNGYATLADDVFIGEQIKSLSKYTIPAVKASTGKGTACLFPYNDIEGGYEPVELDRIKVEAPDVYDYIMEHEEVLKKRSYDTKGGKDLWHVFGRSQGVEDTRKPRVSINSIVRTHEDLEPNLIPVGCGVYGGLYVLIPQSGKDGYKEFTTSWEYVTKMNNYLGLGAKQNDAFDRYVRMLRKYKSGGYYTFSGKDLEKFLNYNYKKDNDAHKEKSCIGNPAEMSGRD